MPEMGPDAVADDGRLRHSLGTNRFNLSEGKPLLWGKWRDETHYHPLVCHISRSPKSRDECGTMSSLEQLERRSHKHLDGAKTSTEILRSSYWVRVVK
jgi:hypothetical protein